MTKLVVKTQAQKARKLATKTNAVAAVPTKSEMLALIKKTFQELSAIDDRNAAIFEAAINSAECILEDEQHQQRLAEQAELDEEYWQNEANQIANDEARDAVYFQQYQ